jgi:hypothetical protein
MSKPNLATDGRTVTVRVPISIRRRGGRKLVLAPDGAKVTAAPVTRHVDNAMVKAIARSFRWRDMLESGEYATITEVVEAIVNGRQPAGLQLDGLMRRFPGGWEVQKSVVLQPDH